MSYFISCGGCGAETPAKRCIGCQHDFGVRSAKQAVSDTPLMDAAMEINDRRDLLSVIGRLERELTEARNLLSIALEYLPDNQMEWAKRAREIVNEKESQ